MLIFIMRQLARLTWSWTYRARPPLQLRLHVGRSQRLGWTFLRYSARRRGLIMYNKRTFLTQLPAVPLGHRRTRHPMRCRVELCAASQSYRSHTPQCSRRAHTLRVRDSSKSDLAQAPRCPPHSTCERRAVMVQPFVGQETSIVRVSWKSTPDCAETVNIQSIPRCSSTYFPATFPVYLLHYRLCDARPRFNFHFTVSNSQSKCVYKRSPHCHSIATVNIFHFSVSSSSHLLQMWVLPINAESRATFATCHHSQSIIHPLSTFATLIQPSERRGRATYCGFSPNLHRISINHSIVPLSVPSNSPMLCHTSHNSNSSTQIVSHESTYYTNTRSPILTVQHCATTVLCRSTVLFPRCEPPFS